MTSTTILFSSFLVAMPAVWGFAPAVAPWVAPQQPPLSSRLNLFDKIFEQDGPLGKGITVGKVQIALMTTDRSSRSIFGQLKRMTDQAGSTQYDLACLAKEVSVDLLRRSDDWIGAASASQWFKEDNAGQAESTFNKWADQEAIKFEKEYLPETSDEKSGATAVVVSLLMEICGDQTNFDGAGYSLQQTKEILQSISSNAMVEDGDFVNAVEVFWAPGDQNEVLSKRDLIVDFPELITL